MTIWKTAGLAMLVLLTGMDSIPPEVYEAAKLDGARRPEALSIDEFARLADAYSDQPSAVL